MNNPPPSKCINCGAGLIPAGENLLKCSYCGSIVSLNTVTQEAEKSESTTQPDQDTAVNKPQSQIAAPQDEPGSGGCAAVFIISAILLVFILIAFAKSRIDGDNTMRAYSEMQDRFKQQDIADSLSRDKLKKDKIKQLKDNIKQLSLINVDTLTFKKLYRTAKKDRNSADEVFIYAPSMYSNGDANAIDAYIYKEEIERTLHFGVHYTAEELLHIQTITFTVDGKIYQYKPTFTTQEEDTIAWERSDDVVNNSNLSMLAHIATSQKTEIKYNGKKHYYKMIIPKVQKAALKRQLQIYKGFLMEYDQ